MKPSRLIFNFEQIPDSPKRRNFLRGKPVNYEKRAESLREIKEKDKEKQQEDLRVAEKMVNNLEIFGIKCPRCNNKHIKAIPGEGTARARSEVSNLAPPRGQSPSANEWVSWDPRSEPIKKRRSELTKKHSKDFNLLHCLDCNYKWKEKR